MLYNYYREPWLISKLHSMLDATFESPPILRMYDARKAILAAGPLIDSLAGGAAAGRHGRPGARASASPRRRRRPTTGRSCTCARRSSRRTTSRGSRSCCAIALFGIFGAARAGGTTIRRFSPHFFVLGAAFLLLETRSLVSFSLLFGSTWLVNALAFFAILASVLLAILVNARWRIQRPGPAVRRRCSWRSPWRSRSRRSRC